VDTILISVFFWVFGQACFATARGIILEIVRKGKKNREKYVELRTKKAHGHSITKGATLVAVNVFLSGCGTACPERIGKTKKPCCLAGSS